MTGVTGQLRKLGEAVSRAEARQLAALPAEERFRLYVLADARGDKQERRRLVDSCPRETWTSPEAAFVDRIRELHTLVGMVVVPALRGGLATLRWLRLAAEVSCDAYLLGIEDAAEDVTAAERNKVEALVEKALDALFLDQMELMVAKARAQLKAVWDAFGAFCEEDLDLPPEEVLRVCCCEPEVETVKAESAEAAADAVERSGWRRFFGVAWRARALGEAEAWEEAHALVECKRAQEAGATEGAAEGKDR